MEKTKRFSLAAVLRARCPACHEGSVLKGPLTTRPACTRCGYNFYPEPGFYLGAMCVGFMLAAVATVPPLIVLKLLNVDIRILIAAPFIEFIFVGTFIVFYSRVLWLHLDYVLSRQLDGEKNQR